MIKMLSNYGDRGCLRDFLSTLVIIGYDDEFKAEEVRLTLRKLQKDYLVGVEDAVVAVKNAKGKVLKTSRNLWI